jgi:hypothetical protein
MVLCMRFSTTRTTLSYYVVAYQSRGDNFCGLGPHLRAPNRRTTLTSIFKTVVSPWKGECSVLPKNIERISTSLGVAFDYQTGFLYLERCLERTVFARDFAGKDLFRWLAQDVEPLPVALDDSAVAEDSPCRPNCSGDSKACSKRAG